MVKQPGDLLHIRAEFPCQASREGLCRIYSPGKTESSPQGIPCRPSPLPAGHSCASIQQEVMMQGAILVQLRRPPFSRPDLTLRMISIEVSSPF
jgi:hypothetical protein